MTETGSMADSASSSVVTNMTNKWERINREREDPNNIMVDELIYFLINTLKINPELVERFRIVGIINPTRMVNQLGGDLERIAANLIAIRRAYVFGDTYRKRLSKVNILLQDIDWNTI